MSLEDAADLIAEHILEQEFVEVFAHHDADGIAAGAILCHALLRAGKHFRLRVRQDITAAEIPGGAAVVLCDMGAGMQDLPGGVVVIDHHVPHFEGEYHLNPHLEQLDERALSASGAAYLVADRMGENRDLASLVLLGIIGDDQSLAGPNHEIVSDGIANGFIAPGRGLRLAGRDLTERLVLSIEPYLAGYSGDPAAVADLLKRSAGNSGIEMDTLLSLLLLGCSRETTAHSMQAVYGATYALGKEVVSDAHTLTALIEACGISGRGGLGASICLRSPLGLDEAWTAMVEYRSKVAGAIRTIKQEGDGPLYTVEDAGITGGIADILARDREQSTPVAVMARSGDWYRLSVRCPTGLERDLEALTRDLATACGGRGGGHACRTGAMIPAGQIALCRKKLAEGLAA